MSGKRNSIITITVASLLMLLNFGCAGSKQEVKAPAIDKEQWDKLAETSKGYSPMPSQREISISDYRQKVEKDSAEIKERALPQEKVSLKMRNAEVRSILRALARSTGINILVKDNVKGTMSVDFVAVPWEQAFQSILKSYGLTYIWEGEILRVITTDDMEQVLKVESIREKQKAQESATLSSEPLSTVIIAIDYADPKSLRDNLQEFLPKEKDGKLTRGSVRVDDHSNSIIIQASREVIAKMIPVIERIDKPTQQILIRANIVETSKDVARDLGIQWGGMSRNQVGNRNLWVTPGGSTTNTTIKDPVTGSYAPVYGNAGLSGQGGGINFPIDPTVVQNAGGVATLGLMYGTIGGNILEMQLQALQSAGKINIVSSPSLTTLDNQKAFTESGETVPYVSTASTGGGAVTQEVKFVDAVLRLEITPHVIDGRNLKMKIVIKKDEVDPTRAVQGNPYIIKKQTETTLIVQNGETIVISGLTKQRNSSTSNGVPGLKDAPGLGWLFKNESNNDSSEEVLIFLTPHILPERTTKVGSVESDGRVSTVK